MNNKTSESVASAYEIGQNIKLMRGMRHLTQKQLCQLLLTEKGITCKNTTLCSYERGRRLPSVDFLSAIAEVCHCDLSDLVGRRLTRDQLTTDDIRALERTLKVVKSMVRTNNISNS